MKKLYNLLLLMSVSLCLSAQYSTPGTGVNWTMDDLVANSGGAVISTEPSVFEIMTELIISASDTLLFTATTIVSVHQDILITVEGTLLTQIPDLDQITFTTYEIDQYFQGFRFDNSPGSLLKNFIISTAGGIKLVESDVIFLNCHFSAFNQGQCTGTIDLYQSRPVIDNCEFLDNAGPAVLSGANSASSPQIINCNIFRNTNSNTNMPQINLGTSGVDSIRIINCQIIGDPELIRVGGIAITTLAGGILEARIENNVIQDNRYGITAYGFDIGSVIRYNQILDNNTQNLPMQGGSGINFWGGASNHSILTGNTITGNLWGITIQANAQPNLGDITGEPANPGMNQLYDNGNGGEIYDLYNDTPDPIMAQNNWWGTMDPDIVEMHIFHQVDDPL
nr:hypothetical protein [Bacteroidota bacterium]